MPCFSPVLYNNHTPVISALASFPTRSLFSAVCRLQLQHCTLWLCSSFVQLWLRHTSMPCAVGSCSSSALSAHSMTQHMHHISPVSLYFQHSTHNKDACSIFPSELCNKLTPVISALALFPTRSLFSAPGLLQLQHCTPVRCRSTAQLCITDTPSHCAVHSSSSSALPAHAQ